MSTDRYHIIEKFIDNKSITKNHYIPSQNQLANV